MVTVYNLFSSQVELFNERRVWLKVINTLNKVCIIIRHLLYLRQLCILFKIIINQLLHFVNKFSWVIDK